MHPALTSKKKTSTFCAGYLRVLLVSLFLANWGSTVFLEKIFFSCFWLRIRINICEKIEYTYVKTKHVIFKKLNKSQMKPSFRCHSSKKRKTRNALQNDLIFKISKYEYLVLLRKDFNRILRFYKLPLLGEFWMIRPLNVGGASEREYRTRQLSQGPVSRYNSIYLKFVRGRSTALLCKGSVASSGHFVSAIPSCILPKKWTWYRFLKFNYFVVIVAVVLNKPCFYFAC